MKWKPEEDQYLSTWYGEIGAQEIANKLGRSKSVVYARATRLGLKGRVISWTDQEVSFLKKNYVNVGARESARKLHRTIQAVHAKARELDCGHPKIGPRNDWPKEEIEFLKNNYQRLSWEELQSSLNRTKSSILHQAQAIGIRRYIEPCPFFEEWTEKSAYAIGFFAADGWVTKRSSNSIRIGFSQKEPDIIYALKDAIGSGRISQKSNGMYEYYVQSVAAYERLCEIFGHDVHRKAKTLRWPNIPEGYIRHFIRGAVDGDGSLFMRKEGLWGFAYSTSSEEFIRSLCDVVFDSTGIKLGVGNNKLGVYHARCVGIKAICLADWLYYNCSIALERKEAIARAMVQTIGVAQESSITEKMKETFPHILSRHIGISH